MAVRIIVKKKRVKFMTKQERLDELKFQEAFFKMMDKGFDKGWRDYMKDVQRQNLTSNLRLFRVLQGIRGSEFISDIIQMMKMIKRPTGLLSIVRTPAGIMIKDGRWKTIPELWIFQKSSSDPGILSNTLCIKIKEGRWLQLYY